MDGTTAPGRRFAGRSRYHGNRPEGLSVSNNIEQATKPTSTEPLAFCGVDFADSVLLESAFPGVLDDSRTSEVCVTSEVFGRSRTSAACFTRAGCAGAELAGSADPERSCRAINLTSVATFTAKVFVRSVDVARADWQIPFVTSVVNTYAQAKRVSCSRRARPIRQVEAAANTSFASRFSNEYTRLGNLSVDLARCYDPGFPTRGQHVPTNALDSAREDRVWQVSVRPPPNS